jgi:hypothetical protein
VRAVGFEVERDIEPLYRATVSVSPSIANPAIDLMEHALPHEGQIKCASIFVDGNEALQLRQLTCPGRRADAC